MSKKPIDKQRARPPKQPWWLRPTTFKVVVSILRLAAKVLDLFD